MSDPSDPPKTFNFHGLTIHVRSLEECAKSDYIVCASVNQVPADSPLHQLQPPNRITACAICATPIYMRPYMPTAPKTICVECFMKVTRPS